MILYNGKDHKTADNSDSRKRFPESEFAFPGKDRRAEKKKAGHRNGGLQKRKNKTIIPELR